MSRIVCIGVLVSLLGMGVARAQVAVTELTPAAPRYFFSDALGIASATVTPDNPAAVQWGAPSRVAFGVFRLNETDPSTPGSDQTFKGKFLGFRGVGERWGFGIESLTAERDTATFKESASSAQLSYQVIPGLALGGGLERSKQDTGANTDTLKGRTFGLSVNLNKFFYLGYAMGTETLDTGAGTSGSRDTTLIGVAVRTEGSVRWHLAWDELDKDDYNGSVSGKGFDATMLTVQAGLGNWLLGGQRFKLEGKSASLDVRSTVFDVGWAPEKGLTVTGRLAKSETTTGGTVTKKDDLRAVNIAYLW
jgi:hypothetical protein